MSSQLNSANDDLVLNATGGSDLVFQQDGVEVDRRGAEGFGKVLQVVSSKVSTTFSTASTTFVNTGISLSITPKLSTSKVLIIFDTVVGSGSNNYAEVAIGNGTTQLRSKEYYINYVATNTIPITLMYQDTPLTTSEVTYNLDLRHFGGTATLGYNGSSVGNSDTTITLMEIGV